MNIIDHILESIDRLEHDETSAVGIGYKRKRNMVESTDLHHIIDLAVIKYSRGGYINVLKYILNGNLRKKNTMLMK